MQGIQDHLAARKMCHLPPIALSKRHGAQLIQGLYGLMLKAFPRHQQPFFKQVTVAEGKMIQEWPMIGGHGGGQVRLASGTGG